MTERVVKKIKFANCRDPTVGLESLELFLSTLLVRGVFSNFPPVGILSPLILHYHVVNLRLLCKSKYLRKGISAS